LKARIFALVDVWDALTSDRPYRKAMTSENIMQYIRIKLATHFDPDLAETISQDDDNETRSNGAIPLNSVT